MIESVTRIPSAFQPIVLFLLFIPVLVLDARSDVRVSEATEDHLRAAMVVGIIRYTSWGDGLGDTLNVCLMGGNQSFTYIEALENSDAISSKKFKVNRVGRQDHRHLDSCHVLVIGDNAPDDFKSTVITQPCLLICDGCGKAKNQVSVSLRKDNNRIRFDVNLNVAKKNKVTFRASMLELAATVEGSYE